MLDTDLLSAIQQHLIEPPDGGATWPSGLWTAAEVLAYGNQRQQALLRETHADVGIAVIDETDSVETVTLPDDWIATLLVLRKDPVSGEYRELPLTDTQQVDLGYGDTLVPGSPQVFVDSESPTLTGRLFPAPSPASILELYYMPMSAPLTGAGEPFALPDELVECGLKWGIIADMLQKIGRAQDQSRVQFAEERFQLAEEAVRLIISGWY